MRKIPTVMVSQHPDNAGKPYWHTEAYISDQYEVRECYLAFSKLGAAEYKWDWEGKFVDESVFERLISEYYSFFHKNPLGLEKFLTYRLPNFRVETEFRLGRALMGILSAAGLARHAGLHVPPLFEAILPMTESAQEVIAVQEAFRELAQLKHPLHRDKSSSLKHLEIIPLFESVDTIIQSSEILRAYIELHKKVFGFSPSYIRPYIARSDPALTAGMIPSILAIKVALSNFKKFEQRTHIKAFPIIGAGSLPFRGGLTPQTVKQFMKEYSGIRTLLVQSAFQYDFLVDDVISAIKRIDSLISKKQAKHVTAAEQAKVQEIIAYFEPVYQRTVKKIGALVYTVATCLPHRRERLRYNGFLKYPRMIGHVKIPRAIGFTASLYSLGIPPEFIGTGRCLKEAKSRGDLQLIEKLYFGLKQDLEQAGRFLNKEVLQKLAKQSSGWKEIQEDVKAIEQYLGHELKPATPEEKSHQAFTGEIFKRFSNGIYMTELIEEAGILRRSLG